MFSEKNLLSFFIRCQKHFSFTTLFLIIYLVGSRIRGIHQEKIMSCVCDCSKCTSRMKINNFLWEALPGKRAPSKYKFTQI